MHGAAVYQRAHHRLGYLEPSDAAVWFFFFFSTILFGTIKDIPYCTPESGAVNYLPFLTLCLTILHVKEAGPVHIFSGYLFLPDIDQLFPLPSNCPHLSLFLSQFVSHLPPLLSSPPSSEVSDSLTHALVWRMGGKHGWKRREESHFADRGSDLHPVRGMG